MKRISIQLIAPALATVMLASCSSIEDPDNRLSTAKVNIHLTDAPCSYDEVNIDVQGIENLH